MLKDLESRDKTVSRRGKTRRRVRRVVSLALSLALVFSLSSAGSAGGIPGVWGIHTGLHPGADPPVATAGLREIEKLSVRDGPEHIHTEACKGGVDTGIGVQSAEKALAEMTVGYSGEESPGDGKTVVLRPTDITSTVDDNGDTVFTGKMEYVDTGVQRDSGDKNGILTDAHAAEWMHYYVGYFTANVRCDGLMKYFKIAVEQNSFIVGALDANGPTCHAAHTITGRLKMANQTFNYTNIYVPGTAARPATYEYWNLGETQFDPTQLFSYNMELIIDSIVCESNPDQSGKGDSYTIYNAPVTISSHIVNPNDTPIPVDNNTHSRKCFCMTNTFQESHVDVTGGTVPNYNRDHNCDICSYTFTKHTFVTSPNLYNKDATQHWQLCTICGQEANRAAHSFSSTEAGHTCTVCSYYTPHKDDSLDHYCDICDTLGTPRMLTQHTYSWKQLNATHHQQECSMTNCRDKVVNYGPHVDTVAPWHYCDSCGYKTDHTWQMHIREEEGTGSGHYEKCDVCSSTQNNGIHVDANTDHYCDVCNYKMSEHTYTWTKTATTHKEACSYCGDVKTPEGAHYDTNQDHNCDLAGCGYKMTEHNWGTPVYVDAAGHQADCTFTGCSVKNTKEAHSDVSPHQNHLCDVCGGKVSEHSYTKHSFAAVMSGSTSTQHGKKCDLYTDSVNTDGCDNIGQLANHVDANQDHYCDVCNYKMTEHNWAANFTSISSTQHAKECTFTGCNVTNAAENHVDAVVPAHYCDVCNYKMTEHDMTKIVIVYSNAEQTKSEVHNTYCTLNPLCTEELGEETHYDNDKDTYCDYCGWGPLYEVTFVGPVTIPSTIPNKGTYNTTWTHGSTCPGRNYELQYKIDNGSWQSLADSQTGTSYSSQLTASRTAEKVTVRLRMKCDDGQASGWVESNEATILQPKIPTYKRTPDTVYEAPNGNEWINESAQVRLTNTSDPALNSFVEYSLDKGATWKKYGGPFTVDETLTDLQYRSAVDSTIVSDTGHAAIFIDTTPPNSPTASKGSDGEWDANTATITITDNGDPGTSASGVKEIQYMAQGDSDWQKYTGPITVSSTAVIMSRVLDNVGNASQMTITNVNITKDAPVVSVTPEVTKITKSNYLLTAEAKPADEVNGAPVDYVVDPDGTKHTNTTGNSGMSVDWTVKANGTYKFEVYDEAGNKGEKSITITNFDRVKPGNVTVELDPSDSWSKDEVTVKFTDGGDTGDALTVGAKVKMIQYYFSDSENPGGTWIDMDKTDSPYPTTKSDKLQWINVRAVDLAGNEGDVTSKKIQIDKNNPNKPAFTSNVPATGDTGWVNRDVTITLADQGDNVPDAESNSGVARVEFKRGIGDWETYSSTITLTGSDTVTAKVIDNVGNESDLESKTWRIDKVAPGATVTKTLEGPQVSVKIDATDDNSGVKSITFNGSTQQGDTGTFMVTSNAKYDLVVEDNAGNQYKTAVEVTELNLDAPPPPEITKNPDTEWSGDDVTVTITPTGDPSIIKRIDFSKDGGVTWEEYTGPFVVTESETITAKVTNTSDVESGTVSEEIKIDRVKPGTPEITADPDKTWTNGNVKITITDTGDVGSGVRDIEYATSITKDAVEADLTWRPYTDPFDISVSTEVFARVTDNVGNKSDVARKIKQIDKTPPGLSYDLDPSGITNKDVDIEYKVNPGSTPGANDLPSDSGDKDVVDKNGDPAPTKATKNESFKVSIEDNAGNKTEITVVVNNIDKLPPNAPTITRGTDADWVADKNQVTIVDNGDTWTEGCVGAGVDHIEYSLDDGTTWTTYNGPFDVTATATVKAKVVDKAGNESSESNQFVGIGDEEPAITIISGPSSVWVKDKDVVKFRVSGVTVGVKKVEVVENGAYKPVLVETPDASSKIYTVDIPVNGSYTLKVTDLMDQEATARFTEERVDSLAPTAKKISQTDPTTWTKTKKITLEVEDLGPDKNGANKAQSGVVKVEAFYETGASPIGSMTAVAPTVDVDGKTTAGKWEITVNKNGMYYFKVYDGVGHFLDQNANANNQIKVDHIDNEPPEVDATVDPNGWTKEDPDLVIDASDDSGIIKDIVVKDEDGNVIWEKHFDPNDPSKQPDWPIRVPVPDNGDYTITVTDPAGNEASKVTEVDNIDKEPPVIDVTGIPDSDVPAFTPTVTVTDNKSGLDKIVIKDKDGNIVKTVICNGELEKVIDDWIVSVNDEYTIEATDRAGNASTEKVKVDCIANSFDPYMGEAGWNRSKDELQGSGLKNKIKEVQGKDGSAKTKYYYDLEKVR